MVLLVITQWGIFRIQPYPGYYFKHGLTHSCIKMAMNCGFQGKNTGIWIGIVVSTAEILPLPIN